MKPCIDMTNQQFKNWLVIERTSPPKKNKNNSNSAWWKCKCVECGNIKDFNGSELRLNRIGACKHKQKNSKPVEQKRESKKCFYKKRTISRVKDEIGNRYGKLIVKSFAYTKNGKAYWNCLCDCGKETIILGAGLRSGSIHSCGCLRSYKEYEISAFLDNQNIPYEQEYSFLELKDKKNLRFDFALFKNNVLVGLIEYNGRQHYSTPEKFNHFGKLQLHDKMKIKYCQENNIPLLILNKDNYNLDNIKQWYLSL